MPDELEVGSFPEVVRAILDAALGPRGDLVAAEAMTTAAAQHGRQRRRQGFAHELLFTEYYLLREVLWRTLKRVAHAADGLDDRSLHAILHLDGAICVATRASITGYHQDELEAMGRWPASLHDIRESALVSRQLGMEAH
ncbi:MAG: hypothetical protein ACJ79S_15310 [Gemmatimonadaceae bacterium]